MLSRQALLFALLFFALPFLACTPPPTEHPIVPHYRFEGKLTCAQCDAEALFSPDTILRVLVLREGSEPGEDIIMFEQDYASSDGARDATSPLELQFPNDRLSTARHVWMEAAYLDPSGEVIALAKQRFVRVVPMPDINTFELELSPPTRTPSLEERLDAQTSP